MLYNPALGLFPLLLVLFLLPVLPVHQSLDYGLAAGTVMLLLFVWFTGKRVFQSFLLTAILTLLVFNSTLLFLPSAFVDAHAFILLETIFVLVISAIKLYENRIHEYIDVNLKIGIKIHLKPALQLFFFVSKLFIYCAPFHLVMLVLFSVLPSGSVHFGFVYFFSLLFPGMIIVIGLFELFNIRWIGSQIKQERYLPILDLNSRVIGHIALSESLEFEKKFLHPVVRIIFKHQNKLYLRERPASFHYEVGKMCLPVEDYVNYGENIEDAAKRVLQQAFGKTKLVSCFLLKHLHEIPDRRSLNYLYLVNLDKEKSIQSKDLVGGKWWTEQQIVDNLNQNFFSSSFESEFEYIQSTVLMADHYGIPIGMYSDTKKAR